MKKFFNNVKYFLVPVLTAITILGIASGGIWVWAGLGFFALGIVIDTLVIKYHTNGTGCDDQGNSYGVKGLQNAVMYLMLPLFIALQCILAWRIYGYANEYHRHRGKFVRGRKPRATVLPFGFACDA